MNLAEILNDQQGTILRSVVAMENLLAQIREDVESMASPRYVSHLGQHVEAMTRAAHYIECLGRYGKKSAGIIG